MNKALIRGLATGISLAIGGWVVTTGVVASQAYHSLQQRDLASFSQQIQRLEQLTKPIHLLTAQQLATLQVVETGAKCSHTLTQAQDHLVAYSQLLLDPAQHDQTVIDQLPADFHQVQQCLFQRLLQSVHQHHLPFLIRQLTLLL